MENHYIMLIIVDFLFLVGGNGGGALGALGANKASTHPVIAIFLYPFGAVEAACDWKWMQWELWILWKGKEWEIGSCGSWEESGSLISSGCNHF
ncbi:hypothetical protein Tco_0722774 [Tanacetum coccineum]